MIQEFLRLVEMVPPAQLIDQIIQGVKYEEYTKKVDGKEK
jgi:hypothetical protein